MRNAFIEELVQAASLQDNIALVVGDLGYGVVEPFAKQFPKRFFNAGVAEQNMMSLSAGLASEGFHVFVYSIANFPTFRCAEQIRNDVDYHKLAVTIVAVGGGLAYGNLGYSHHAIQDYALMRSMPNILIGAPGDPMEVRSVVRYLINNPQPSYLRLGKAGEPNYHEELPHLTPGDWVKVRQSSLSKENNLRCFLTTGACLGIASQYVISNRLFAEYEILSMPLWSMQVKSKQHNMVKNYDEIIIVEDHLTDGGFGSWMMESMPNRSGLRDRIYSLGLTKDVCGSVGSQAALNELGGLLSFHGKL